MTIDLSSLEQTYDLPSGLLSAVRDAESNGDPNAVSPKGATGAFQFMPDTAAAYGINPKDPDQSAIGAARMFSDLSKQYDGDVPSMLAAYNWGSGNLDKHGIENAPAETKGYISKILGKIGDAIVPPAEAAEASQGGAGRDFSSELFGPDASTANSPAPSGNSSTTKAEADAAVKQAFQPDQGRDMSDELFPSGGNLPTGSDELRPAFNVAVNDATDMAKSGAADVSTGWNNLKNADSFGSGLGAVGKMAEGEGKGMLSALGYATSPLESLTRSYVANPVHNATGLPAGLVDFGAGLVTPLAAEKTLSMAGKAAKGLGAVYDMVKGAGAAGDAAEAAETPYNITNGLGAQAKPSDTVADFATKSPDAPQAAAANQNTIPMTAGEATQNADAQRMEADATAGMYGSDAQNAMNLARAAKTEAATSSLQKLGNFDVEGQPSDEMSHIVNLVQSDAAATKANVNSLYADARAKTPGVTIDPKSMANGLVPDLADIKSRYRIGSNVTGDATAVYDDLMQTIAGHSEPGMPPLSAPVLLEKGEDWRTFATQTASNANPQNAAAIRKMVGAYDNFMTHTADNLQGATGDAINSWKNAIAARADYGARFENNDLVDKIVNSGRDVSQGGNGMSNDDLTRAFIGNGNIAGKPGMAANARALMTASGENAPLTQSHMQSMLSQNVYNLSKSGKLANGTDDALSMPKLQTHLDNLFNKQGDLAQVVYGDRPNSIGGMRDMVENLRQVNARQPNVGNASNSGYTLQRLAGGASGILGHTPPFSWMKHGVDAIINMRKTREVKQLASGTLPQRFVPSNDFPAGTSGVGLAATNAVDQNQ